jgi:hypothetical protein
MRKDNGQKADDNEFRALHGTSRVRRWASPFPP